MSIAENGSLKKKLEDKKSNNPNVLDVYFLGFDSLSQMSFRRKLKKTVKVLEDIIGSVVLNGILFSFENELFTFSSETFHSFGA